MKNLSQIKQELSNQLPISFIDNKLESTYSVQVEFSLVRHKFNVPKGIYELAYYDESQSFCYSIDTSVIEAAPPDERMHTNDFYELMIVNSGVVEFVIEGSRYLVKKEGSAFSIIEPNTLNPQKLATPSIAYVSVPTILSEMTKT